MATQRYNRCISPLNSKVTLCEKIFRPSKTGKALPGVVDIEEIPEHLEAQLEAEVMAAFEANGGGA